MTRHSITMAEFDWILEGSPTRQRCQELYGHLENSTPSEKTVICTIAIISLTILLEVAVHLSFSSCDIRQHKQDEEEVTGLPDQPSTDGSAIPDATLISEQPQLKVELQAEPQTTSAAEEEKDSRAANSKSDTPVCTSCCLPSPSPHTRATRLAIALLLYSAILAVFVLRIHEATHLPKADFLCVRIIHNPHPNWTAIAFLNIIPFVCASFAFLRALIDCLLARYGRNLKYDFGGGGCLWTPCMPFMGVFAVGYLAFECVKVPAALVMGDREVSFWTTDWKAKSGVKADEIEMHGEESQGLIDHDDGDGNVEEEGADGPPAYNEVAIPGVSVDGKGKKEDLE